jgi:hypothetical protein
MRRLVILGILLAAGCQSTVGPFGHRTPERVDDPAVPISEQERRGRDRLALPERSKTAVPSTYGDYSIPNGQ